MNRRSRTNEWNKRGKRNARSNKGDAKRTPSQRSTPLISADGTRVRRRQPTPPPLPSEIFARLDLQMTTTRSTPRQHCTLHSRHNNNGCRCAYSSAADTGSRGGGCVAYYQRSVANKDRTDRRGNRRLASTTACVDPASLHVTPLPSPGQPYR